MIATPLPKRSKSRAKIAVVRAIESFVDTIVIIMLFKATQSTLLVSRPLPVKQDAGGR